MQENKEQLENKQLPKDYWLPFTIFEILNLKKSYQASPPNQENIHDIYIYRMILAYDELAMKHDKLQKEIEKNPNGVKTLKQNILELTNKLNEAKQINKALSESFKESVDQISNIEKKDNEKYSNLINENKVLQDRFNDINNQFNNLLVIYNELKTKEFNRPYQKIIRFFRGVK